MELPTVGRTPLLEVEGVFTKLECCNPTGSIKDRMVFHVLTESEKTGRLRKGMTIIEATSGNTGIALSFFGREKGYRVVIVMPENMTTERKELIRSLGAELVLCSAEGAFAEAAAIRDRMAGEDPDRYFNPDQFSNPLNVECHRRMTGAEIVGGMKRLGRRVDAFVAGVGTGGTLIGVGTALREAFGDVHIAAIEPEEAAVMSGGEYNPHLIGGIGDGFIPAIASDGRGGLHPMIDEVIRVCDREAVDAAQRIGSEHKLCVGVSSGANFLGARRLRERFETVVTVFADGSLKYASLGIAGTASCPYRTERGYDSRLSLFECPRA